MSPSNHQVVILPSGICLPGNNGAWWELAQALALAAWSNYEKDKQEMIDERKSFLKNALRFGELSDVQKYEQYKRSFISSVQRGLGLLPPLCVIVINYVF